MFSIKQKREIADQVQEILRRTNHPELPSGEVQFHLHVKGAESWSWADIRNNGAVQDPYLNANPWNERHLENKQKTTLLHGLLHGPDDKPSSGS